MQEFRIGDVLSRSFSVFFKNFVPFMLLTAIVYTPAIVLTLRAGGGDLSGDLDEQGGFLSDVLNILLQLFASAVVMYGVIQQLRGQHASMGACVAMGIKRLLPVIGSGFFMLVAIGGAALVGALIIFAAPIIGALFMVIPALIVYFMLYVTIPVAVIERPGVLAALGRSRELTRGYKGHIFLILLLLWGGALGVGYVLGTLELTSGAGVALGLAVEIFFGALGAVVTAVVYHDLRVVKEGVNVDDLVRVFE